MIFLKINLKSIFFFQFSVLLLHGNLTIFVIVSGIVSIIELLLLHLLLSHEFLLHVVLFFLISTLAIFFLTIIIDVFFILVHFNLFVIIFHHLLHFLLPFQFFHVLDILSILHFSGGHRESLLIKKSNDSLLAEHELDDTLSFVLVKVIIFIEDSGAILALSSLSPSCHSASGLWWRDEIDTDAQSRLRSVNFHLSMFLVLLAFRLNLINCLL